MQTITAMAGNKTRATDADAEMFINQVPDTLMRHDCRILAAMMQRITGHQPVMWGPSIVGFGSYHYKYASGREGDTFEAGFAPRKANIAVYLMGTIPDRANLLEALGKHKMGRACLSIQRLHQVDVHILEELVGRSVTAIRAAHG